MTHSIPVFDPRGPAGERTGFVRAGSWPDAPSCRREAPGYTMWAGPRFVVIQGAFPGIAPDHLRIHVEGTRLDFTISSRPSSPRGGSNRRRGDARKGIVRFSVELPYGVDPEQAEVRKENGWVSVVLRKQDADSVDCRNARAKGNTIRKTA